MENSIRKSLHGIHFKYSTKIYPFKETIEKFMGYDLGLIHEQLGGFNQFKRDNDQSTLAHRVFYANYSEKVEGLYKKFIKEIISNIVTEPFYYQKIPTFRLGFPNNKFVGEFHTDSTYNHQGYEINFNLGLANYRGEASLIVEEKESSKDFMKLECKYGEIFSFDHIDCLHGSKPNPYNVTMASFDFRLAVKRLYKETDDSSVNLKSRFIPGEYFSKETIN